MRKNEFKWVVGSPPISLLDGFVNHPGTWLLSVNHIVTDMALLQILLQFIISDLVWPPLLWLLVPRPTAISRISPILSSEIPPSMLLSVALW
jgi:hypothetical protein